MPQVNLSAPRERYISTCIPSLSPVDPLLVLGDSKSGRHPVVPVVGRGLMPNGKFEFS